MRSNVALQYVEILALRFDDRMILRCALNGKMTCN
jgi:hypothetical protein